MDTKLKRSNKVLIIYVLSVIALVLASTTLKAGLEMSYYDLEMVMVLGYAISLVVLPLAIINVTVSWYQERKENQKELKMIFLDRIKVEIIILAMLAMSSIWIIVMYTWMYGMDELYALICSALFFIPVITVFVGCIMLLIRKRMYGIMGETSIIAQLWKQLKWKKETPFDEYMSKKNARYLYLEIACFAVALIWFFWEESVFGSFYGYPTAMQFFWSLAILMLFAGIVIAVLHCISNREYKDVGILMQKIEQIATGEAAADVELSKESLFYKGWEYLSTIKKNIERAVDKQMRDEQMKIDLITNVSHDLKTPLTSMMNYTELLKKEQLSEEAKDYVAVLSKKQEQLKDMIQDLFDLSKVTSGAEELEKEELDLRKLLEQTIVDMEEQLYGGGIIMKIDLEEGEAPFVGDGKKLYRVFQNLLENAVKYSMKGTRVFVELRKNGKKTRVTIKNTAAYEMNFTEEQILERFTRGDESRNTEGHGLGLAIAHSYTRAMGGELNVHVDGDLFKVSTTF